MGICHDIAVLGQNDTGAGAGKCRIQTTGIPVRVDLHDRRCDLFGNTTHGILTVGVDVRIIRVEVGLGLDL